MIFSFTEKLTKLVKPKANRDTYFALCWKEKQVQSKAILILSFIVVFSFFFFPPFSISLGN